MLQKPAQQKGAKVEEMRAGEELGLREETV